MGNYYLYQIAYFLTRAMPRRAAYVFAMMLADAHYLFSIADRKAVEGNLKKVMNSPNVSAGAVRQVFRNFGKYLADFFTQTKFLDNAFINRHVQLRNTEYLNEVLAQQRGCIIVSAHLGNWELAGAVLAKLGYPLSIVALAHQDPRVNAFFDAQREFFGITVIPTSIAVRRCIEHLKNNRVLAILAERDFTQHGIPTEFFGLPTMVPKGAAMFSLKTGAPIVPGFFIRMDNDDYRIEFAPPIYPPQQPSKFKVTDQEIESLMRQYIHLIENEIRKYPQQWLMFRKFEV